MGSSADTPSAVFLELYKAAAVWAAVFLALWALVSFVVLQPRFLNGVSRRTWGVKISMLMHHLVVGSIAFYATISDLPLREALFTSPASSAVALLLVRAPSGPPPLFARLLPITLGYMVADLALVGAWDLKGKGVREEFILMLAHHVLSLISWPFALAYDFCARYVLIFLAYELTSVFLTIRWMLGAVGLKTGRAYLLNGAVFTLSFLVMRVVGCIPQIAALLLSPPWRASASELGLLGWMPTFSTWLLLPHLLNLFWGWKVFSGALAMVRPRKLVVAALEGPLLDARLAASSPS